jgi:hypothetical protein
MFKNIKSYAFDITFPGDDLPFLDHEDADIWMHPISDPSLNGRLGSVQDQKWNTAIERAVHEQIMASPMNLPNLLMCTIFASSYTPQTRALGMLKYYFEKVFWDGKQFVDPYVLGPNGKQHSQRGDSMAVSRITMLLNLHLYELSHFSNAVVEALPVKDAVYEVVEYMFQDPLYNGAEIKKAFESTARGVGCVSRTGVYPKWQDINWSMSRPELSIFNDEYVKNDPPDLAFSIVDFEAHQETSAFLRKNGMIKFAEIHDLSRSAAIGTDLDMFLMVVDYVPKMAGYARGMTHKIHREAIEGATAEYGSPSENAKFNEYVFKEGFDAGNYLMEKFPSKNEFRRRAALSMTTSSAGGPSFELIFNYGGREERIMSKSKISNFYHDPDFYTTVEGLLEARRTLDTPGTAASRQVPIKKDRLVTPHAMYGGELAYGWRLNDYINDTRGDKRRPVGTHFDFTPGSEVGNVLKDHVASFVATSHFKYICLNTDFTAFDLAQKFGTSQIPGSRYAFFQGIRKAIVDSGKSQASLFSDKEGNPMTILEVWDLLGSVGYKQMAHFVSKSQLPRTKNAHLVIDALLSGEFTTLMENSVVNRADLLYFMDNTPFGMWDLTLIATYITGDDRTLILESSSGSIQTDPKSYANLRKVMAEQSASHNFHYNLLKTLVMSWKTEFLKKTVHRGCYIPALGLQMFQSESVDLQTPPIELMRGLISKWALMISRGMSSEFISRFAFMAFAFKRGVRSVLTLSGEKVFGTYNMPMAAYFVPKGKGGLGEFLYLLASSSDLALPFLYRENPVLKRMVDRTVPILKAYGVRKAPIVDAILKTHAYDKGSLYLHKNVMERTKLRNALAVEEEVMKLGVPVKNLGYPHLPTSILRKAIMSDKITARIANNLQNSQGSSMLKVDESAQSSDANEGIWTAFIDMHRIIDNEAPVPVERTFEGASPLRYMEPLFDDCIRRFGLDLTRSAEGLGPAQILTAFRRGGRNDISPDQITNLISDPRFYASKDTSIKILTYIGIDGPQAHQIASNVHRAVSGLKIAEALRGLRSGNTVTGYMVSDRIVDTPPTGALSSIIPDVFFIVEMQRLCRSRLSGKVDVPYKYIPRRMKGMSRAMLKTLTHIGNLSVIEDEDYD